MNNPPICYTTVDSQACSIRSQGVDPAAKDHPGPACDDTVPPVTPAVGGGLFTLNFTIFGTPDSQPVTPCIPNFTGQNAIPGPYIAANSFDGVPGFGGCYYPESGGVAAQNNPAPPQFWDCDGGLLMIDPVYVNKGAVQPNFMTAYPQTTIPIGQPVTPITTVP